MPGQAGGAANWSDSNAVVAAAADLAPPPAHPNAQQVISQQAKKLEELDSLYRDEALARKKIHNAMEDMKGKIRVYCRVRPILQLEKDKGQAGAYARAGPNG